MFIYIGTKNLCFRINKAGLNGEKQFARFLGKSNIK